MKFALKYFCFSIFMACNLSCIDTLAGSAACSGLDAAHCSTTLTRAGRCAWGWIENKCFAPQKKGSLAYSCEDIKNESDCNPKYCNWDEGLCKDYCPQQTSFSSCSEDRCVFLGAFGSRVCVMQDDCNMMVEADCNENEKCKWVYADLSLGSYCMPNCAQFDSFSACKNGSFRCQWVRGKSLSSAHCQLIGYPE